VLLELFLRSTKTKKLYNGEKELIDISASLTPQKGFIKAGGSYAIVFGKKATNICCYNFKYRYTSGIRLRQRNFYRWTRSYRSRKIFNKTLLGQLQAKFYMQVQMCVSEVNIVGSQDTTGLMTSQEWSLWQL
jgi:aconitate hydratase 2/2-methylisocitrate dehydratase